MGEVELVRVLTLMDGTRTWTQGFEIPESGCVITIRIDKKLQALRIVVNPDGSFVVTEVDNDNLVGV